MCGTTCTSLAGTVELLEHPAAHLERERLARVALGEPRLDEDHQPLRARALVLHADGDRAAGDGAGAGVADAPRRPGGRSCAPRG